MRRASRASLAVVPFVESRGLLANGERVAGAMVRGVLPEEEVKAVGLGARMREGTLESLQPGKFQIILGSALAHELGVRCGRQGGAHGARGQRHTRRIPAAHAAVHGKRRSSSPACTSSTAASRSRT